MAFTLSDCSEISREIENPKSLRSCLGESHAVEMIPEKCAWQHQTRPFKIEADIIQSSPYDSPLPRSYGAATPSPIFNTEYSIEPMVMTVPFRVENQVVEKYNCNSDDDIFFGERSKSLHKCVFNKNSENDPFEFPIHPINNDHENDQDMTKPNTIHKETYKNNAILSVITSDIVNSSPIIP